MRMLRLIITADDLGIDPQRDEGIFLAHERGAITQASLMVAGVSAVTAAAGARARGLALGLHLDLTETPPSAPPETVPSLLDAQGQKRGKHGLRAALARGEIDPADVARETRAQIDAFAALVGAPPRHVDGHQHAHCAPGLAEVLAPVLAAAGVLTTRIPEQREVHVDDPDAARFYRGVSDDAVRARAIYARHGIGTTDAFVGLDLMGFASDATRLREAVRAHAADRSVELMCHPGLVGAGGDEFNRSPAREHELAVLSTLPFAELVHGGIAALSSFEALARTGALAR